MTEKSKENMKIFFARTRLKRTSEKTKFAWSFLSISVVLFFLGEDKSNPVENHEKARLWNIEK